MLTLLSEGWGWTEVDTYGLLHSSLMLTATGILAMIVLKQVSPASWRLRSWLIAAVLLQGIMVARSPVHLGWIETRTEPAASVTESAWDGISILPSEDSRVNRSDATLSPPFGPTSFRPTSFRPFAAISRFDVGVIAVMGWASVLSLIVGLSLWRYVRLLAVLRKFDRAPRQWQDGWRSIVKQSRRVADATRCDMLFSKSVGPLMVRHPAGYSLIVPERFWIGLTAEQRRGVMLHELAHVERRDVWWQLVARGIAVVHWFNPIAWWALRQFENAAEYACDDRVAREGRAAAAGFASALVELAHWDSGDDQPHHQPNRGIGLQAMSAPPLSNRVTKLLKPDPSGGSRMKPTLIAVLTVVLVLLSFVQLRLTTAQEDQADRDSEAGLQVLDTQTEVRLEALVESLDSDDPTTARLASLWEDAEGKVAIAGLLNTLRSQARDAAGAQAIPRFVEAHFERNQEGKLVPRSSSTEHLARWAGQAERLTASIANVNAATADVAERLDTDSEAGGLFKRFLNDPQAAVAVLMSEMKGGDLVSRYLSEALGRMLVEREDGQFVIVESRRGEAEKQVTQFELAEEMRLRLQRTLPLLADEYADVDERHRRLKRYLKDPVTAIVVALQLSSEVPTAGQAVDRIHEHFENASVDKPDGMRIQAEKAWTQIDEIFERVDRVKRMLPRVHDRLVQISATLSAEDELTSRLARAMKREPVAALLAAELPYADVDVGQELRQRLDTVMTESDGKFRINEAQEGEIKEKAIELLRVCRQVRRYQAEINAFLAEMEDQSFVQSMGDSGPYVMLSEIRRNAENHRPDVVSLLEDQLLVREGKQPARVREDRREVVRQLVEQADRLRSEAGNDDF
ncbi:MAG: M56 family metallopeptidase [Rubripirellula sp.]